MSRRIYLASSWRNEYQPAALAMLRQHGHEVYDSRNPHPGDHGFSWNDIDPDPATRLTAAGLRSTLAHPIAERGFKNDFDAMKWADTCVLLLPCGMSAHLEAGWMAGAGRDVVVYAPEVREPELMYKVFDLPDGTPIYGEPLSVLSVLARVTSAVRR